MDTLLSAKLMPEQPDWKKGLVPHPGLVRWMMEQYIAKVGINEHLIPMILDSGGEKMMIDVALCKAIGLRYQRPRGSEFGKYLTAGGKCSRTMVLSAAQLTSVWGLTWYSLCALSR